MTQRNNIYYFEQFGAIPGLVHGFSTRSFGSMRLKDARAAEHLQTFAKALTISSQTIVTMHQVHGNHVVWVDKKDGGTMIPATDGLATQEKDIFPVVLAGDCMPVLFYDKKKQVCAIAHAGWKGMYNEVIPAVVKSLIDAGSRPGNILVGLGPCIRGCCYTIGEERAKLIREKGGDTSAYLLHREDKLFFSIPELAMEQLAKLGIPKKNIEDSGICTFDSKNKFYSYRKEGKDFGEFVGIIGMK